MSDHHTKAETYKLSGQVGFNLRRANQRHVAIFSQYVQDLTPTQFAALARLQERGALSQNRLGRLTAMDSATIKGVVGRLKDKGLVETHPDQSDQRLRLISLTPQGRRCFETAADQALHARRETLEPLTQAERAIFEDLLSKLT
ncbi:MAG: MarR family transcriptional regulator [Rhodobacteraceae bacterium]|nr:MarR family transcriptional regulator [Paracoccaceae bacterium]